MFILINIGFILYMFFNSKNSNKKFFFIKNSEDTIFKVLIFEILLALIFTIISILAISNMDILWDTSSLNQNYNNKLINILKELLSQWDNKLEEIKDLKIIIDDLNSQIENLKTSSNITSVNDSLLIDVKNDN